MIRFVFVFLYFALASPSDNPLVWDSAYKLQWSDFKGEPQEHIDAVAVTASGLSFSFSASTTTSELIHYSAEVIAHFYPSKSWYKSDRVNEIVLAHEQLHFDITELNARKLRYRISTTKFTTNIKKEMNRLLDNANKDLELMQEKYDAESNYSMNVETQKKWQIAVRRELLGLKEFK